MKNNKKLYCISIILVLLLHHMQSQAQIKDVKWEPWTSISCFQGLSVSTLNMGWGKEAEGYLWGVRFRNDYDRPVSFQYTLIIGDEPYKGGPGNTYKLKPGEVWTNGGNVFNANLFKTSSTNWKVKIEEVCFDGMRCGGNDDCYADCDVAPKKINQPCGLEDNKSAKKNEKQNENETANEDGQDIKPGYYTFDENKALVIKVEKIDDKLIVIGLYGGLEVGNRVSQREVIPGIYKGSIRKFGYTVISKHLSAGKFAYIETDSNEVTKTTLTFTFKSTQLNSETKQVPATENKTVSGDCPINGRWFVASNNAPYYGDYFLDFSCSGDMITIKYTKRMGGWNGNVPDGTISTAKQSSTYKIIGTGITPTRIWEGLCPFESSGRINYPCAWIYDASQNWIFMQPKGEQYGISFYRIQ